MVRVMSRLLLVVNPQASAVTEERTAAVRAALGPDAEVVRTERPGHAVDLVRDADAEVVVVFGGDGAFNEALNGVRPGVTLGFVPGGGSSVLPRALGLPRDPQEAARRIKVGRTREISVGRVNGRRFGFAAALGFPAEIVRRVDDLGRADGRRPPDRTFATTIARALIERRGRLDPVLEVEGEPAAFALIANGNPYTYFGRLPLRFAPDARFEAGLDVVAPRQVRGRSIPRLLGAALLGRRASGVVYRRDLDRVRIEFAKPLALQVDGEDLGDVEEATVEAERAAVTILV